MTNRSSNKAAVPEAKGALDKFKYEVASELGVPLTEGYNGDLTSRQNGSVGGYMVNTIFSQGHTVCNRGNAHKYEYCFDVAI
uniref:alpha/beta-type small acid-soluble spore protein n=1 Tax=Lachnoclostridium phocaeense TaxID=1871021 RepID=UPI0026DC44CA|nr:alpha/beta-type small acid-soluble spore protein [Lachnoclostridium phocaeense]